MPLQVRNVEIIDMTAILSLKVKQTLDKKLTINIAEKSHDVTVCFGGSVEKPVLPKSAKCVRILLPRVFSEKVGYFIPTCSSTNKMTQENFLHTKFQGTAKLRPYFIYICEV